MDREEEDGLRAFALTVTTAETSGPEQPRRLELGGVRSDVVAIDATWREEERLGFRVRLADGSSILLYYVPELNLWSGAWPDRGVEHMVRRRL